MCQYRCHINYLFRKWCLAAYIDDEACYWLKRKLIAELNILSPSNRMPERLQWNNTCKKAMKHNECQDLRTSNFSVRTGNQTVIFFSCVHEHWVIRNPKQNKLLQIPLNWLSLCRNQTSRTSKSKVGLSFETRFVISLWDGFSVHPEYGSEAGYCSWNGCLCLCLKEEQASTLADKSAMEVNFSEYM